MDQSAFKKYLINQLPTNPGEITPVTVTDGGNTFKAWNVGKLYFGWRLDAAPDSGISAVSITASADRLAFLLGETINTNYFSDVNINAGNRVFWNGAAWVASGSSAETLLGFLIN